MLEISNNWRNDCEKRREQMENKTGKKIVTSTNINI